VRAELIDLIVCPACKGELQLEAREEKHSEIWEGSLSCTRCNSTYLVNEGLPHLYVNDETWQPKAEEAEGWVALHKDLDIYDVVEDSVDLKIPYYPEEPWIGVARSFDIALNKLNLTGSETILDLGAGRGWASKEFAKRGCKIVALDITSDNNVGLGRAKALMDEAGVYFDRLIADGENLPFNENSFDLVFCAATLHHSSNLPLLCQNIEQVLKPNGRLCAINEPCISIIDSAKKVLARDASHELRVGINETRPNLKAYEQALAHSGFRGVQMRPVQGMTMNGHELLAWGQDLGAIAPDFSLLFRQPRRLVLQLGRFLARRLIALGRGSLFDARRYAASVSQTSVETAVLLWVGGEMFLLAQTAGPDS
jgi:SAM-dependent methyltransferase/uncharacterized protein YbaR (Trm112 family)